MILIFALLPLLALAQQHIFQDSGEYRPALILDKQRIIADISRTQSKNDTAYFPRKAYPPLKWNRQRGIYDSFVHLNIHGQYPQMAILRRGYHFPDDNAFVTMFVAHALVEASQIDPSLMIDKEDILMAVEAISTHRDKNSPSGLPLYSFWNQVKYGDHSYRASPPNIEIPLGEAKDGLEFIRKGLEKLPVDLKAIKKVLDAILSIGSSFWTVFSIPPDSDDTGCNLAFGMELLNAKKAYPEAAELWSQINKPETGQLFQYFLRYSYQPMSDNYELSAIDPRTYIWIRSFVNDEKLAGRKPILITTWMQSISELEFQRMYKKMPFNVNNVDASVTANAVYGMTAYFKRPDSIAVDQAVSQMYLDNVRLLAFILKHRLVEKYGSLALLYYPPKYAFYWFTSRILASLNTGSLDKSPNASFLKKAKAILEPAAETYLTKEIIDSMNCGEDSCYWDDFLGNGDKFKNQTKKSYEDRVFSTSTALNALLDTWTIKKEVDGTFKLLFKESTPTMVKLVIEKGHYWLKYYSYKFSKENAFFSGSVKSGESNPYYFPHNDFRLVNGTKLGACSQYKNVAEFGGFAKLTASVSSVVGVIPEAEYQQMMDTHECFGLKFPQWVVGASLNCDKCTFPFWSSPAMTDAMTLLATVKFSSAYQSF